MCVSYRTTLNSVTKPSQYYPIPHCDNSVIFFISLNALQGYHQVSVQTIDREKLAFFSRMTINIALM